MILGVLFVSSLCRALAASDCDAACVKAQQKQILGYRDTSVKPCEDFYLHACGGFITNATIDGDAQESSVWTHLQDKLNLDIKTSLQGMAEDTTSPLKGLNRWASHLNELCLDTAPLESQSIPTMQAMLDDIFPSSLSNSSKPIGERMTNEPDFGQSFAKSMAKIWRLGIDPFFVLSVGSDISDTTRKSFYLLVQFGNDGGLLLKKEYFALLRKDYQELAQVYFDKLFAGGLKRRGNSTELVQFEEQIYSDWNENCLSTGCGATHSQVQNTASFLNWTVFFSELFPKKSSAEIQNLHFVFGQAGTFQNLDRLLRKKPISFIMDLVMMKMAGAALLPKDLRDVAASFNKRVLNQNSPPRSEICQQTTLDTFKWIVSRRYVEGHFNTNSRTVAADILSNIRKAFIVDLSKLTWMDSVTRANAVEKANAMLLKVGYPDWIKDDTKMLDYHALMDGTRLGDVPLPSTLFQTFYKGKQFQRDLMLAEQGTKVDRSLWVKAPTDLSPYYNSHNNDIVFPASYLQPPLFDVRLPLAYLYGTIGTVMGHELTHGFDNAGRLRDKDGEEKDWWTVNATKAFNERAACMKSQYDNYEVHGEAGKKLKVNGMKTLGENIADNGGLHYSFAALHHLRKPGDQAAKTQLKDSCAAPKLTEEQMFFYGFAQHWCGKTRPEVMKFTIADSVHAPGPTRVLGSTANAGQFAAAFKCATVAGVPSGGRCELWGGYEASTHGVLPCRCNNNCDSTDESVSSSRVGCLLWTVLAFMLSKEMSFVEA